jgi:hypothetical protein
MKRKSYMGLNIQYPISQLIIDGTKTVETRTYPLSNEKVGEIFALIETPGRDGKFKARVIALIRFTEVFPYTSSSEFYKDTKRHRVSPESPWKWNDEKPKWGWVVKVERVFKIPLQAPKKRGIVFTKQVYI